MDRCSRPWHGSADRRRRRPGGRRCVRLVTTRLPDLLTGNDTTRIRVDEMSVEQAGRVLTRDLPGISALSDLPTETAQGLLRVTGRWPLLLRIVNRLITAETTTGPDTATAAADVLDGRVMALLVESRARA